MRYPEGHKEAVRAQIVAQAAKSLREKGLAGVSISGLMNQVGLTHGGFYAHFKNRDELVAEAILAAGQETAEGVFGPAEDIEQVFDAYLSPSHVEHAERGCVVAALGTQAAGQSEVVREAFDVAARGLIELVAQELSGGGELSDEALATTARMVGGVILARLVDDPELSQRILDAARSA